MRTWVWSPRPHFHKPDMEVCACNCHAEKVEFTGQLAKPICKFQAYKRPSFKKLTWIVSEKTWGWPQTSILTHTHTNIHTHIHIHTHVHMYMYINTHIHAHRDRNTHMSKLENPQTFLFRYCNWRIFHNLTFTIHYEINLHPQTLLFQSHTF